jgi:hypothetical protein
MKTVGVSKFYIILKSQYDETLLEQSRAERYYANTRPYPIDSPILNDKRYNYIHFVVVSHQGWSHFAELISPCVAFEYRLLKRYNEMTPHMYSYSFPR